MLESIKHYYNEQPVFALAMIATTVLIIVKAYRFINASKNRTKYAGSRDARKRYHGKGVLVASNGDKYSGYFEHGKKHGKGTYDFAQGGSYSGDFRKGQITGQGRSVSTLSLSFFLSFLLSRSCV